MIITVCYRQKKIVFNFYFGALLVLKIIRTEQIESWFHFEEMAVKFPYRFLFKKLNVPIA